MIYQYHYDCNIYVNRINATFEQLSSF